VSRKGYWFGRKVGSRWPGAFCEKDSASQIPLECMLSKEFQRIVSLDGLPFIEALLKFEEERFDTSFLRQSVYEDINDDFGIFPAAKVYPLYFMGEIRKPKNKIIFIGINPGYNEALNKVEQEYLENRGSFEGYCSFFKQRATIRKNSAYFANIGGFLRRMGLMNEKMTWQWLQDNFINMDLIPYHSTNASGLRINNLQHYRNRYFIPITKIIDYLRPERPIFIVGFPTFEKYLSDPMFANLIEFKKQDSIWVGIILNKYKFIGLPFLNRVAGGKDKLVETAKQYL
jgi:hypothetical protein